MIGQPYRGCNCVYLHQCSTVITRMTTPSSGSFNYLKPFIMKRRYAVLFAVLALASCTRDYQPPSAQKIPVYDMLGSETEIPVEEWC